MTVLAEKVGILAAYLSATKRSGQWIGIMITASHNPVQDNGIKLIDANGCVPPEEWEAIAVQFANESDIDGLRGLVQGPSAVYIGKDTRPSSDHLEGQLQRGAASVRAKVVLGGLMSTPKCHYAVHALNAGNTCAYEDWLANAFPPKATPNLVIDMANGVGAITGAFLKGLLPGCGFINTASATTDVLNHECGADYVKFNNAPPRNAGDRLKEYAAFDGDADRLLMFYFSSGRFRLLDGDKMAALLAVYCARAGLHVGVVQTAYANGASTRFLESKGIPVVCTCTGVKYLHRAAKHDFADIGIYFEANGHGTVLFNSQRAIATLPKLHSLSNQLIGDAVSDLLMVLFVLGESGMRSFAEWDRLYEELPSRQLKVQVPDRRLYACEHADRRLVSPPGLQPKIDALVAQFKHGRAFVRPSGTEDVLRVYAEAELQAEADALAASIRDLLLGGSE